MNLCFFSCSVLFFMSGVLSDRGASCPLPTIRNGRIRSRQRGRVIKFVCLSGFQLAGERNAFCVNGVWDMLAPKCVKTTCPKQTTPPLNGLILPSHGGGVLNFYCKQGYELHGPAAVFCDGVRWDNHMPSCIPANTKPTLFCDFEDANLCHWTHDLNHDMDWKRDSYKTPTGYSMDTGPSNDHTKGEGKNGHYMYIESSSRRLNDTARLISPIFNKTMSNNCLEFWYHMYGRTTGSLRAYVKKVTDPWPLQAKNAVFSETGNQGNVWYRALVNLGVMDQDYQIIMEGIRGNGYVSDTAIDDIRIIENCTYEDYIFSTTEALPVSEILKTVESCENRCGQKATGNESSQIITCDCDDYCYDDHRCCPDYVDICFISTSTIDFETTTETVSITQKLPVPNNATAKNVTSFPKNPTEAPTILTEVVTAVKIVPITTKPVPPKVLIPSRRPIIIIPTSPPIYRRIFPDVPKVNNKNTSKIVFVKPKTPTTYKTTLNDVIERINDEELLLTSPLPLDDDNNIPLLEKEDYVEKISNDKEYIESNDVYPEKLGEIKTEFRQTQSEHSYVKVIFVVIAAVCGVATLAIVLALVLVKYRIVRFRNRRIASGNGDSQSDVRFLTADEILDFSLDNNDDL